jgi:3-hydroxy-9,10-secoandrosta-1,3,5(10)-triene-9,17-dione monooxygenase reductase component
MEDRMSDEDFDSSEFRRVLGHFPTGVTVVTAETEDGPAGMAIGSFSSVSLDPPLVMFCPGRDSASWAQMSTSDSFCVNVLGDDQKALSDLFASRIDDKFNGVATRTEATGSPVIEGALAWIDCENYAIHDGGDHDIVVGRVVALGTDAAGGPLLFFKGGYGRFEEL